MFVRVINPTKAHICRGGKELVVLVPLLSTPDCSDAVTVRYRTALNRTGADFHHPILPPSQAYERLRVALSPGTRVIQCQHPDGGISLPVHEPKHDERPALLLQIQAR